MSRAELDTLRKMKRLKELEAKAAGKAQPSAPAAESEGAGQTALEGFGQTATMGYLPHIQAAAETGIDKLGELFGVGPAAEDAKLRAQGFKLPERGYVQARDENIARQDAQAKEHPLASMLGKGAGIAATSMLPIGAAKGAASVGGAFLRGGASGATQGALYNPGDTKGEVSPLQLEDRGKNALIGGAIGAPLGAVGYGVTKLADKSRMVDRVKDSAGLSRSVKKDINQALQGVNEKYISPRSAQVKKLQQGMTSEINPDRLKGISPGLDALSTRMADKVNEQGRRVMSDQKADRLRQLLDARAGYNNAKPYEAGALAKGEGAKAAADILRRQINAKPGVGVLKDEMKSAANLRDTLARQSNSAPISSIRGAPGTDKGSLVDAIDKMSGSKLEKLSGEITDASDLIIHPGNFFKPLQALNETKKLGIRGAAGAARAVDAATPDQALEMALRALFEAKR